MAFNHPVTKLKSLYTSVIKVIPLKRCTIQIFLSLAQATAMNKFVCNTGADPNPFTYYYACSLCIDVPFPRKKKKNRKTVAFPDFFWGEGLFIHRLYHYLLVVCLNCFFQQERFKWFLVPCLIKNGRTLWKLASTFLGILTQSFVTNINWNQCKVLLGIVINLLWICFEGSFSILRSSSCSSQNVLSESEVYRFIWINPNKRLAEWAHRCTNFKFNVN